VTLHWQPTGRPETARLVVYVSGARRAEPQLRQHVHSEASASAGPASLLLARTGARPAPLFRKRASRDGVSIKAVAEYVGHADAGFTLRTYTPMMPASDDRMRRAVDRALAATVDGPSRALDVPSGER
jgi:integrase